MFDHTKVASADIRSHIVAYTVSSIQYPALVSDLAGTFTFNVVRQCTSLVASTLTQALEYTVTSAPTFSYTAPAFAADPLDCTIVYSSLSPAFNVATRTWTWADLNSMSKTSINSPYYLDRVITISATSHDGSLSATA